MSDAPLVLGIETSCDETGVGIVRGETLLVDAIASSVDAARALRWRGARGGQPRPPGGDGADHRAGLPRGRRPAGRRRRARRDQRARAGRRPAGRRRGGQGARHRPRQAAVRRQPPGRARRGRPARARPAARAHHGAAGLRWPLLAAARAGRDARRPAAGRDHRRRGGRGLRQGRSAARPAVPRRPAHRPGGSRRRPGVDRVPARPDQAQGPRALPLRLLVLRAEDSGRALGRGRGSRWARTCPCPTSRRASRRPWSTC